LNEISKILSGDMDKDVHIFFTDKHIVFEFDRTTVVSRLIEGEYFKIDQMLSSDYETKVRINKKEFLNCIDRATLLVKEGDKKPIIINMTDEVMDRYIRDSLDKMIELGQVPLLSANVNRERLFLKADDIVYIEKYKKNTRVHLSENSIRIYGIRDLTDSDIPDIRMPDKLENIYERLKKYGFGYPHDSYIINFKYLTYCTSKLLRLKGVDNMFQITRSKAQEFHVLKEEFMLSKYKDGN